MTHPTRAFSGSIINRFTGSKILCQRGSNYCGFSNTTLKQKNPAVEILLSIRRTRPFRADRLPLYLCTIRNGIRNFACAFAYNAFGLASSVCLTVGRLLLSMSSTIVPVSSV